MKPMRENHQHETAAAIAPGAVLSGFAGSTQPAGLFVDRLREEYKPRVTK
jgi:hypothetical protein